MIDLNILKIAGAFVAGVAGIIGILGQTRTPDNKLTRSGKWLVGIAIAGVVLAVGTQIGEWRKSIEDDRAARQQNHDLLVSLNKEVALARTSLHQVKRAVTRFQNPSISFDTFFDFDSTNEAFGPYLGELANLAEAAISKPSDSENSNQGLRVERSNFMGKEHINFFVDSDSPAMPDERKYPGARRYIREAVPEISVFKKPISPESFVARFITHSEIVRNYSMMPDLRLKLSSGNVSIHFGLQKDECKVPTIEVSRLDMKGSTSFTNGKIVSLEDLSGCQGIVSLPSGGPKEFPQFWKAASRFVLYCRVNDQITFTSHPTRTQAQDQPIYIFTFALDNQ